MKKSIPIIISVVLAVVLIILCVPNFTLASRNSWLKNKNINLYNENKTLQYQFDELTVLNNKLQNQLRNADDEYKLTIDTQTCISDLIIDKLQQERMYTNSLDLSKEELEEREKKLEPLENALSALGWNKLTEEEIEAFAKK